jgi:hypothetical protein
MPKTKASSALQYAMRDRLTALGWSRIETVPDRMKRLPIALYRNRSTVTSKKPMREKC